MFRLTFEVKQKMKLEKKYNQNKGEYYCDLTRKLDDLCGYTVSNPRYKHYICDTGDLWENRFAIRVPGRTVGSIKIDKSNFIEEIIFSNDLVGDLKQYPPNIYQMVEAYLGKALEM